MADNALFFRVILCDALLPTATFPKAKEVLLACNWLVVVDPVPLKDTVADGVAGSLLLTIKTVLRFPVAVGLNVMLTVHDIF